MHLCLTGINHQTAPPTVRQKVAIRSEMLAESLSALKPEIPNCVILATCNRTEIYFDALNNATAEKKAFYYLKSLLTIPTDDSESYIYSKHGIDAAEHLFRVISGLESMIVGEYEILGQVRAALEAAEKVGMAGFSLRLLFNKSISLGRRIREETGISKNAVSISSAAVDLAETKIGDIRKHRFLVIGTGEAGRLAAKVAVERGAAFIGVLSHKRERAEALASLFNVAPLDLNNLEDELSRTDVVITCSGAPHPVLSIEQVKKAMASRIETPLVIIDIAVPQNVDSGVKNIPGVFVYGLDDLKTICEANRKLRKHAIRQAEIIILEELSKLDRQWHDFEARPIVRALMIKTEKVRSIQLESTVKKLPLLTGEQLNYLEAMTKSIVSKILQDPIDYIKADGNESSEIIGKIFKLDWEETVLNIESKK